MEINIKNKELYESAFVPNGEYKAAHDGWKPSIDEREIMDMCETEDGQCIPATPLGYRDYTEARLDGLGKILTQPADAVFENDSLHNIEKGDSRLMMYGKISINGDDYVVVGDDDENFYFVNGDNHMFYVSYVSKIE